MCVKILLEYVLWVICLILVLPSTSEWYVDTTPPYVVLVDTMIIGLIYTLDPSWVSTAPADVPAPNGTIMTSSNGNIFWVTGPLWGQSSGAWKNGWINNRDAGDLRCHYPRDEVTVMQNNQQVQWRLRSSQCLEMPQHLMVTGHQ